MSMASFQSYVNLPEGTRDTMCYTTFWTKILTTKDQDRRVCFQQSNMAMEAMTQLATGEFTRG